MHTLAHSVVPRVCRGLIPRPGYWKAPFIKWHRVVGPLGLQILQPQILHPQIQPIRVQMPILQLQRTNCIIIIFFVAETSIVPKVQIGNRGMGRFNTASRWWDLDKSMVLLLVAQIVKSLPAVQETPVWSLGRKDPLEKEMATYSSLLAWRIPCTEATGGVAKGQMRWSDLTLS